MLNKCINLRYRKKKGIIYQICLKSGYKLKYDIKNDYICNDCPYKEYKLCTKLTKKSSKLSKLEKNRYSILTSDMNHCFLCNNTKNDVHEIYAGRNRQSSMKNGFCIPICRKCHTNIQNNEYEMLKLKRLCQEKYELNHSRDEFINIIGKNYLD